MAYTCAEMSQDVHSESERAYDPYAPAVVRKMAALALVLALLGLAFTVAFALWGWTGYQEYSRQVRAGEAIHTVALDAALLRFFGPAGPLVFYELAAVGMAVVTGCSVREWWVMRTGHYDPQRDQAPPSVYMKAAAIGVGGVLLFLAIVRLAALWF
jgi:hypothetical protein